MPKVALGEWAPDSSAVDSPALYLAQNVFPTARGYEPVPGPTTVSTALPANCKGAIGLRTTTGTTVFFAGTASKLYKFDPVASGWTDVSNGSTPYSVPEDDYWSFVPYGQTLLAIHANAVAQKIDINIGSTFADVGGSPPRARFGTVVGEFVMLGGLVDYPSRVAWSALANPDFWTPGIDFSDVQDFPEGGDVTALAGGEFGVVFQRRAIRRMVFAPGTPEVFQFSLIERDRGAVSPWSTFQRGSAIYFVGDEGLFRFSADGSQAIGANRVNAWFSNNMDRPYLARAVAVADPSSTRIFWAFKSQAGSDISVLDTILVFDPQIDRWATISLTVRTLANVSTPGLTLDSLPGSLDDLGSISLDSAIYAGGVPALATFGVDNKMNFLEGASLEALLETSDAMVARPEQAFVSGVRVDTDSDSYAAQVGTRDALSDAVTWRSEGTPGRRKFCPARAKGRYHRLRLRIPAGADWSYASAFEVNPVGVGQ